MTAIRVRKAVLVFMSLLVLSCLVGREASTAEGLTAGSRDDSFESISTLLRIYVDHIEIMGNTVVGADELRAVAADYEHRTITSDELQSLRRELTAVYVAKGYVTSGAVIPDQQLRGGIIRVTIVEGRFDEVEIVGNRHLRTGYLMGRLLRDLGPVPNVHEIQRALSLLEQNPRIKRINGELRPGSDLGETSLKVHVEENRPYSAGLEFGNTKPPSIGGEEGIVRLAHHSLTGNGDTFSAGFGITEGFLDYDLSYAYPLNCRDTTLKIQHRRNENVIVEEPFEDLNMESRTETYGMTLTHPVYRGLGRELTLGMTGEYRHSETFLLGRSFSFWSEEATGETNLAAFRFFQEYTDRSEKRVIAARSTFSLGTNEFWEERIPHDPFLTWLGQVQWIRRLGQSDWQLVFRTDIQISTEPLPAMERFSIGGMDSVRGYRESRLTRDDGVASAVEMRVPIVQNSKGETTLQLVPFVDFGASWNARGYTPDPLTIGSTGLGIRWAVHPRVHLQLFGGIPFRTFHERDEDMQDLGVHFRVTSQVF